MFFDMFIIDLLVFVLYYNLLVKIEKYYSKIVIDIDMGVCYFCIIFVFNEEKFLVLDVFYNYSY